MKEKQINKNDLLLLSLPLKQCHWLQKDIY